jgi:APA family basic amino acid/polyamine antiporter
MSQQPKPNEIETELSRDLGLTSALAIGIGTMIAAGIFTLSGLAINNVGSGAIVSFILAAIVATFTALTYCEFVSIYPQTGEGYLYARKTFAAPVAYFVGWALFLGYASSCAFYIASLSSYFYEFIYEMPIKALSGIIILIALTLLNIRGTKESGKFQVIVTAVKVILLIWFIIGGLKYIEPAQLVEKFNSDFLALGSTAAMVFITFFGFSAIAASAGEVKDPVKNIPKAIFISMAVVSILYILVVLVVLFADLTEYTEASMGEAAKKFLGGPGGYVIIGGAIFSMISASNASIMAGARVLLSMSQLGHLPKELGVINEKTRTPVVSTIVIGGAIIIFSLILPLEDLSYFSNTVLLIALILVNAALIIHRKKFPDIERPFKVPLVPLLPLLGIVANIYLITQIFQHPLPLFLAIGALIIGMLGFVAWKGTEAEEKAIPGLSSVVAHGQGDGTQNKNKFRVLVPIANPNNIKRLIEMAASIAAERNGELLLLNVVKVPEQVSPSSLNPQVLENEKLIIRQAQQYAASSGATVSSIIRVGHNVARAILETSRERNCNLILLGWKGHTTNAEKMLGTITDAIITHARTDLMLVKLAGTESIRRVLLPTAGGEHAQAAEEYAASLMKKTQGKLTICRVISPNATTNEVTQNEDSLQEALNRIAVFNGFPATSTTIQNQDVEDGIIEASTDYDAIMVGAAGQSIYPQILFGNIPEAIAKHTNKTVIVVKNHHPVKALVGRIIGE